MRLIPCCTFVATACLLSVFSTSSIANLRQQLDWVPLEELSQQQREKLAPGSCGAYISPLEDRSTFADERTRFPTEASSMHSEVSEENGQKKITFLGDVIVRQGYQQLQAARAVYQEATGEIIIDGDLTLRQPDLLLLADKGVVNQYEDTLVIDGVTYVIHSAGLRGSGQRLSKEQHRIVLQDSSITRCEPGHNDWTLKGSQIEINTQTRQGVAKHVSLRIKGVPVFYFPYLRFPIGDERMSGFLYPSVALNDGDIDVSIPYYFNLAPHYDLTLTPHLLARHGVLFEANARHLSRLFATELTLSHLGNDKGELSSSEQGLVDNGSKTSAEVNPFKGRDRWSVNLQQTGGQGRRWFSEIDYSAVSDTDYLDDFDGSSLNTSSDVSLLQRIRVGYHFAHWKLKINNQQYQTLDNDIRKPYKLLPQINLDGRYRWQDVQFGLDNEWVRFDHSENDGSVLTGQRTRLKYFMQWQHEGVAGFFRPRLQVRYLGYHLDDQGLNATENTRPAIFAPQAVIDTGLFFDRSARNYQQTFEPRLYYFYSPFKDHSDLTDSSRNINFDTSYRTLGYDQLFSDTRFSGGDRIDDDHRLTLGLTTRFIGNDSGREWLSASIAQAWYFDERAVSLSGVPDNANRSPIALRLSSQLSQHWRLSNDTVYDDIDHHLLDNTLAIKYRSRRYLFNLGYRFLHNDNPSLETEQVELSGAFPVMSRWNLVLHQDYDLARTYTLERLLGLEYNSCCYQVRFAYKRQIDDDQVGLANPDYDEGIVLEFRFLGLGGTGKQFDKVFNKAIDGYEQWQASYPSSN